MNDMLLNVKESRLTDEFCCVKAVQWLLEDNTDSRVQKAAWRLAESCVNGTPISVRHEQGCGEKYTIDIRKDSIQIAASGAAGAFYGLVTLKAMIQDDQVPCGIIVDYPDMEYRGFYQDTTRGRIPTLDTLKKLVDMMADFKLNSLQLYVEHSFEFKEYAFCHDKLGYITVDEMRQLDAYCKERFIDLVPSLSCFGHLYHLLQSDAYKHLCELKDYQPKNQHFMERMAHHTINPLLDESFELIKSLIDQHMQAFSSQYFNICCDETFDLGTDVNRDKDKGDLYIGFIKKLTDYIKSKGKTPMMWADIALHHADRLSELPEDIVLLNWDYEPDPKASNFALLADKVQIACPGTTSWHGFTERPNIEESNILKSAQLGYKYDASGILNTNWGDLGNLASINMALYGLVLGALAGWNKNFALNASVKAQISRRLYGNDSAIQVLDKFGEILNVTHWSRYLHNDVTSIERTEFDSAAAICQQAISDIREMKFDIDGMKDEFILAAEGYALLIKWFAKKQGFHVACSVDFETWLKNYSYMWLCNSKMSELDELKRIFVISEASTLNEIPIYV